MKLPDRDTTSGGPSLLVVFVVLSLIITTVYYREPTTGPVHTLRAGVKALTAPVATAGEYVTRPVRGGIEWFTGFGVRREELEELSEQNAALRVQVAELEEARQENDRLRELIGFVEVRELASVGAHVIGRPSSSWESVFTIDVGTDDGIDIGMPVLGAYGLLGQTVHVTDGSATVRLLSDQRSGAAALIQSSRAEGIVRGTIDGGLRLDLISVETTVQVGDVVLTSGMGGVYPKGLLIGEISQVDFSESDLYQRIDVHPAASLEGVEEVIVLTDTAMVPDLEVGE